MNQLVYYHSGSYLEALQSLSNRNYYALLSVENGGPGNPGIIFQFILLEFRPAGAEVQDGC